MDSVTSDCDSKPKRETKAAKPYRKHSYTRNTQKRRRDSDNHFRNVCPYRGGRRLVVELDVSRRCAFVRCVERLQTACAGNDKRAVGRCCRVDEIRRSRDYVGDPDLFARYEKKPDRYRLQITDRSFNILDNEDANGIYGFSSYDPFDESDLDKAKRLQKMKELLKLLNDYVPHRRHYTLGN